MHVLCVHKRYIDFRAFLHDITVATLVFQNNDTAGMCMYQTDPVGIEFFSYENTFFCSSKFTKLLARE